MSLEQVEEFRQWAARNVYVDAHASLRILASGEVQPEILDALAKMCVPEGGTAHQGRALIGEQSDEAKALFVASMFFALHQGYDLALAHAAQGRNWHEEIKQGQR